MARIVKRAQPAPAVINTFLGINESPDGQFNLKLGEASYMRNWRVTKNGQLKKREGYALRCATEGGPVRGMWYGKIIRASTSDEEQEEEQTEAGQDEGEYVFLFAQGGHIWRGNLETGTASIVGAVEDAPVCFTAFDGKVYIQDGDGFYVYDGNTMTEVEGYRPLVFVSTPPDGGGTPYEQLNVLTGAKCQQFSPDGDKVMFQLAEADIDIVDYVMLNGEPVEPSAYTVNEGAGTVTLTQAPPEGTNTLEIGWTKGSGQRDIVEKNRFCMLYNGQNSNRAHMWGNPDAPNRRIWSGLEMRNGGKPSMEYWEANAYTDVCGPQFAITDIVTQYDAQRIFTDAGAYYSEYTTLELENGIVQADFPTRELNADVGNVAPGQVRVVNNSPITLFKGVRAWDASNVRNQVNEREIGLRVRSLLDKDLTAAVTVNWQEKGEYWVCVGSTVWVWNYVMDVWYIFDNIPATCFLVVDGKLHFGAENGVHAFEEHMAADNGTAYKTIWKMGFFDFGANWLYKYMTNCWIGVKPEGSVALNVSLNTDVEGVGAPETIQMRIFTFMHMNFAHFSFKTSANPQPRRIETQSGGFVYAQLILENESSNETATVLSITMPVRYGGKVQ